MDVKKQELDLLDFAKSDNSSFSVVKCEKVSMKPIIKNVITASAKKLIPFNEELKGFHVRDNKGDVIIVSGIINNINADKDKCEISIRGIKDSTESFTFHISSDTNLFNKASYFELEDRISALMNVKDKECIDVVFGPYYGTTSWSLFYGDEKKSATKFELKA